MYAVREIVGPKALFHVLMSASELFTITEECRIPAEIGPITFKGELHNGTGKPYIYLNIPNATPTTLHQIGNLAITEDAPVPNKPSRWRKVASTSAAWGAGVPAALVATPGGMLVGGAPAVLAVAFAPVAIPGTVMVGLVFGGGAAAGATAGTVTGHFTGKKVEEAWDRNHEKTV